MACSSWRAARSTGPGRRCTSPQTPSLWMVWRNHWTPSRTWFRSTAPRPATGITTARRTPTVRIAAATGLRSPSLRVVHSIVRRRAAESTAARKSASQNGFTSSAVRTTAAMTRKTRRRRAWRSDMRARLEVGVHPAGGHAGGGEGASDVVDHRRHARHEGHGLARGRAPEGERSSHLLHPPPHARPRVDVPRGAEHDADAVPLPADVLGAVGELGPAALAVEERHAAEAGAVRLHVLHDGPDRGDARSGGEEQEIAALRLLDGE